MRRRLHWLGSVALVLASSHLGRPALAQSLVDAARLARETRQELGPPTKVYTEEDLPNIGGITEPTQAWASRYRSLLEAALARERALLWLRSLQPVTPPEPMAVLVKTVQPDPPPAPPTSGIPLSLVYSGYPVFGASGSSPRRRPSTRVPASPVRHPLGSRARGRRARIDTTRRPPTADRRDEPSTRRPPATNGYAESSRPFSNIVPGIPARPRTGLPSIRVRSRGRADFLSGPIGANR
jgi:hypothetical protein